MAAAVSDMCEIEASVTTGLEIPSADEIFEKYHTKAECDRGKITFNLPLVQVKELLNASSIDHVMVVLLKRFEFKFSDSKEECMSQLEDLVSDVDWEIGLKSWKNVFQFDKDFTHLPVSNHQEIVCKRRQKENETASEDVGIPEKKPKIMNPDLPSFRVTCYRTGKGHPFTSNDAACSFGGAVQDYFGWNVKMKNFDIEVILCIQKDYIQVGVALTKESLHRRNVKHFGITTLRPTIGYNMLRLCEIKPGDVVCEPMCGGGTIPIESCLNWKTNFTLSGDIQDINGVEKTKLNLAEFCSADKVDVVQWDVTHLPLMDNIIDVLITDLPFGKRSGSKMRNWHLYPRALREMARVARFKTARAVLLTQDKKCMIKVLKGMSKLWCHTSSRMINIGGLTAGVYCLRRTNKSLDEVPPYDPTLPAKESEQNPQ